MVPFVCCLSSTWTSDVVQYNAPVPDEPIPGIDVCTFSECLRQPLTSLALISDATQLSACSADRVKAEADVSFQANPWDLCKAVTYGVSDCFVRAIQLSSADCLAGHPL